MSLTSWKRQYYPVSAKSRNVTGSRAAALKHSLRKWKGLRGEVLAAHDVERQGETLVSVGKPLASGLMVAASTCALCQRYLYSEEHPACEGCPLFEVRGRFACDKCIEKDYGRSPYEDFVRKGDPEPMISWLLLAAEWCRMHPEK